MIKTNSRYYYGHCGGIPTVRLSYVEIKNFRSISSITVNFDLRCRILIGINGSGKTNILQALSLLDSNRKLTPDDLRTFPPQEDPDQEAYVRFVFTFDKDERTANYENAVKHILCLNLSVPIVTYKDKQLSVSQYFDTRTEGIHEVDVRKGSRSTFYWELNDSFSVVPGWKKPSNKCPADYKIQVSPSELINFKDIKLIHETAASAVPPEYLTDIILEDIETIAGEQIINIVNDKLPGCLYWSYSDSLLLPGQISLDGFAANPNSCQPLKHMFALADIDDIPGTIARAKKQTNGIRNLLNRVAYRSTEHMRNVWKDYRGISIVLQPNGPHIDAQIKDEHNLFDFSRRSDGFKRFITFLLMVSAKVRTEELVNTLYLHDEPDVSLHPSGARYLRDELIKIADNNYVVMSTHSIFMVDRELIRRHLIVEKKGEITTIREVNDSNIVDEEVIYNAIGYSIFENLKPINIIFEGWRDKRLYQVALKSAPSKYKPLKTTLSEIGICHARGVKDIGRVTPMLELANRKWVILSDGDRPAIEQQRQYNGEGPWYRYDQFLPPEEIAITGEDFIKPEILHRHIEAIRSERPELTELSVATLSGPDPIINILRKWLLDSGCNPETLRPLLESLKEKIFNDLKPSHIEEKYYLMLTNLASALSTT